MKSTRWSGLMEQTLILPSCMIGQSTSRRLLRPFYAGNPRGSKNCEDRNRVDSLTDSPMITPQDWIKALVRPQVGHFEPYVPGRSMESVRRELGLKKIIKLASNENPLGPSAKALAAIRKVGKK